MTIDAEDKNNAYSTIVNFIPSDDSDGKEYFVADVVVHYITENTDSKIEENLQNYCKDNGRDAYYKKFVK